MNYTEKYHLPQWVKSDRIMMDDFNRMCADMESGLVKNAQDAAAAVKKAESTAAAAAARAQSTADSAVSKANAAQATANNAYCPGKYPYVLGSYMGTGELGVERPVSLGFSPRFVMVTARVTNAINVHVMGGRGVTDIHPINITDDGFTAVQYNGWPEVNEKGVTYIFIAFP